MSATIGTVRKPPAVVLRTHVAGSGVLALLRQLISDLGEDRVFVLFDATRGAADLAAIASAGVASTHILQITDEECKGVNPMHDVGYGHDAASWSFWHPETGMVLMHEFLRQGLIEDDEPLWFIEYDVRCHGSFATALRRLEDAAAADAGPDGRVDVIAMGGGEGQLRLRRAATEPEWCWFPQLNGDIAHAVPLEGRVGCFFPLVRLSGRMLRLLRSNFGRSTGFCEVYVPTLCAAEPGFVASGFCAEAVGQFSYSPRITQPEWLMHTLTAAVDHKLYHPIK